MSTLTRKDKLLDKIVTSNEIGGFIEKNEENHVWNMYEKLMEV